jgi:hypothetical protein
MADDPKKLSFYQTVTAAVSDMIKHGFDTPKRVEKWLAAIREAASRDAVSVVKLTEELSKFLKGIYKKQVTNEGLLKNNKGVPRFTLKRVEPKLRDELDKRIMASAQLIRMNREARIAETLQRFAGWSTSIPAGGAADGTEKNPVKLSIGKALKSLPFEERRVIIDQGHKFTSALNEILATDGGAIAARWHSNWRQRNYNFREDHKERDEKIYIVPGNWALEKGLIRQGLPSTDSITKPGEEVFCRCFAEFLYSLEDLPKTMLTKKGLDAIAAAKQAFDAA